MRLDDEVIAGLDRSPDVIAALTRVAPAWLLLTPVTVQGATSGVLSLLSWRLVRCTISQA